MFGLLVDGPSTCFYCQPAVLDPEQMWSDTDPVTAETRNICVVQAFLSEIISLAVKR